MAKKIPVILDVDTGIDDAVSVLIALKSKKLAVKLIVTCHGNTTLENITDNTLDVLAVLGHGDIPVAQGMANALVRDRSHEFAHGIDGLGGYEIDSGLSVVSDSALEATHKLLQNVTEPVTYICVAPVTNLANLLKHYPEDVKKIKEAVIMSGSNEPVKEGKLPYREFNASVDPEATELVLKSPVKKVFISMEMGHTAYLDWHDVYKTKNLNEFGSILEKIYRSYKDYHVQNGIATHDGCAVAYVIDPDMFEVVPAHVFVKYYKEFDSGIAVVDYKKTPNVIMTTKVNVSRFKKLYFQSLRKCKVYKK